jgi:protein-S-isoprenylcysteine O-methyltransferase Ste14
VADVPIEERGPDVVAPPPLIYLGPLLAGLALDRFLPLPRLPAALRGAGLPLLAGGIGLGGWFIASMRRAGTPVDPYQPPTALVEKGPFRFTRNPPTSASRSPTPGSASSPGVAGRWSFCPACWGGSIEE